MVAGDRVESLVNPADPVVIAVAGDERYALGIAVTIHTALANLNPECRVHLLMIDGGLGSDSRGRIERIVSQSHPEATLEWHLCHSHRYSDLKVSPWGSTSNYLRLLIPDLLAKSVGTAIYLDSDLMINTDLNRLWHRAHSINPNYRVLAVKDYRHPTAKSAFGDKTDVLGLAPQSPYFNSGVMVLELDAWRRYGIAEQTAEVMRGYHQLFRYSDQDGLNVVLNSKWSPLDERWNVALAVLDHHVGRQRSSRREARRMKRDLIEQSYIVHFVGAEKPWNPGYVGLLGRRFRSTLCRSGWFNSRAEMTLWKLTFWMDGRRMRAGVKRLFRRYPRVGALLRKLFR